MIEMDMPKLEVVENDDFYAKVVCEPLEKGFGLTIGNCLRRILLSALPGAAVEGIKFLDGSVKHEFSSVVGIKEDVTEIMWEPWHFRFVGRYHATRIHELGLCLEEYIETYYPEQIQD